MKVIIVFLLLAAASPLAGISFARDGGSAYTGADGFRLSLSDGRLYLADEHIAFGQIDRFGLVRTLSDPYGSPPSLRPRASAFSRTGERSGFVLSLGPLSAGASLNGRPLLFASAEFSHFEAAVLLAFPGEDPGTIVSDAYREETGRVLYAGISGGYGVFSAMGIFSFSDTKGIGLFGSAGVEYGGYSLYAMAGDPISLYGGRDTRLFGIRGSIGEEGFRSEFSVIFGGVPVFSDEFMPYQAVLRSELAVEGIRLESVMRYSFTRTGRTYKSDIITLSFDGLRIGYSSSGGLIASYSHGMFEIGIEDGRAYAEVQLDFGAEDADVMIRLHSDGEIETGVSLVL